MPQYHVRVASDDLVFSASHFLTLPRGKCEPLHGHDYRVIAELHGPLGKNHYVVDFLLLQDLLQKITGELDHRVLLAAENPAIRLETDPQRVEVNVDGRQWVLPRADCVLLPLASTTTELLAEYVGRQLIDRLEARIGTQPVEVRLEIRESRGYSAICVLSKD